MSNFAFLESYWSDLAKLGGLAEKYVMCCLNTADRGLRENLCITTAAENRIAEEAGWY